MPTVQRSALVPYSAQAMYELVSAIDSYPEFLPWCAAACIEEQTEHTQLASVSIDAKFQQTTFSTRNALVPGQEIQMTLDDGPFKHLFGVWRFKALGDHGCRVQLDVDFEFKSTALAALIGPAFSKICDSIVNAFVARAHETLS